MPLPIHTNSSREAREACAVTDIQSSPPMRSAGQAGQGSPPWALLAWGYKKPPTALCIKVHPHLAHSTLFQSTLFSHIPDSAYCYYGVLETQHRGLVEDGESCTELNLEPPQTPPNSEYTSSLLLNVPLCLQEACPDGTAGLAHCTAKLVYRLAFLSLPFQEA